MKKLLVVLLLSATLGGCATTAPTTTRATIQRVLATQTAAWNRGDVAGFMQGYWQSDSLVFIGKRGLTYGWQPTLENYRRSYPDAADLTGHFLLVFRRINGQWVIVADHSS